MSDSYLIDGYNLLFTLGLLDRGEGTHALEKARTRLLDRLKEAFGDAAHNVTIVFDATRAPPRAKANAEQHYKGLHVQFALGKQIADDVIEVLIAQSTSPRSLIVISNDHRLRQAAQRKGAQSWTCDDFLDHLEQRDEAPPRAARPDADRSAPLSGDETRKWLDEFKDVADDPEFKELFERYDFGEFDEEE